MSLKNAWLGLIGELPTVEKIVEVQVEKIVERVVRVPVIGDSVMVNLYATALPNGEVENRPSYGSNFDIFPVTVVTYFETCALAHKAAREAQWPQHSWKFEPDKGTVREFKAIKVGDEFFPIPSSFYGVKVEPKPKITMADMPGE